ncbi:hypothetical protein RJ640_011515 [Escallonia rubra]|uniref:Pyruvate kinase n=1 Tax=Escallonia rubra TaxID=112253 RepID=A0AA88RB24_9ASTE|nr:hypothetical protein RJ640_011515 [Escallonia rubra]
MKLLLCNIRILTLESPLVQSCEDGKKLMVLLSLSLSQVMFHVQDWLDIDFGIAEGVDFIAISFVKSAEVINHLKSYIKARARDSDISVIAKIESIDSLKNLEEIIQASDGAMVARGDLGAQIPLEQVPSAQQKIVQLCRQLNKPVIVASQLLESMIEYPTPTRAEVADVSEAVRQRADALMLSGESAMGQFPDKALTVLRSVSLRIERWWREEKRHEAMELQDIASSFSDSISEEICNSAAKMANNLEVDALFVYTKNGHMASLLSRCRPDCPIFAFTTTTSVRRRLNLQWGLIPFRLSFSDDMESNLNKTFSLLKARGMIKSGDLYQVGACRGGSHDYDFARTAAFSGSVRRAIERLQRSYNFNTSTRRVGINVNRWKKEVDYLSNRSGANPHQAYRQSPSTLIMKMLNSLCEFGAKTIQWDEDLASSWLSCMNKSINFAPMSPNAHYQNH